MAIMTLRAYARYRDVSLFAVQKAIETGRISMDPDGRIDSEIADREWEENTRSRTSGIATGDPESNNGSVQGGSQYAQARAQREHYAALLAKLEYEERAGRLVRKDQVEEAAFRTFRDFRDRMQDIPDRLSAILGAKTDPAEIHQILSAEIRTALNDFADQPSVQSKVLDQIH
jgi:hypothetical protein